MKKLASLLILLVAMFALSQCSDDNGTAPAPNDESAGTQIATETFNALGATLDDISNMSSDELRNVSFAPLRNGFENALDKDADNPIGHLGLSIVELLELNYSPDIWGVIDSLGSWLYGPSAVASHAEARQKTLIGRQFSLIVEAPLAVNVRAATSYPPTLTFGHIQQVIEDVILPKLRRAMAHLDVTERHTDAKLRMRIESGGVVEYIVIDLGEIYVFDASLHALAAGFGMAIARDMDLLGPDGTYNWLNELTSLEEMTDPWCAQAYQLHSATPYDSIDVFYQSNYGSAHADSLFIRILYHNLENRSTFLALRDNGEALQNAGDDLLGTLEKLENGVDFIRNIRENETEENVIKLTDLTDIDASLSGPNVPNFAKNFTKIEDVVEFVRSLLTDVVPFSEELGPNHVTFQWQMNLGRQFTDPEPSLKSLLPYHEWNLPAGNWISVLDQLDRWDTGGSSYYLYVWNGTDCEEFYYPQIGVVNTHWQQFSLEWGQGEPLVLLDGPGGNPIEPSVARMPYFPDYTFNGLFPDMASRQRWLDLLDILDPQVSPPPSVSRR
jgi:hypothetical protein